MSSDDTTRQPPPKRKALPPSLQATLDNDEALSQIYDSTLPSTTDTNTRYAAYAVRLKTILRSAHRYVAYTSDIGESFRPVAHPYLIRTAYGVSWAYLAGDVTNEGLKSWVRNRALVKAAGQEKDARAVTGVEQNAKNVTSAVVDAAKSPKDAPEEKLDDTRQNFAGMVRDLMRPTPAPIAPIDDYRSVMAERAVFQALASMGLPALTIHTVVRQSGRFLKTAKNVKLRSYGPIGLGLAIVPALPFVFDHPVETGVSWTFRKGFELYGGKEAIGHHEESKKEL